MPLVAPGRQRDRDWEAGYQAGALPPPSTKKYQHEKSVLSLLVLGSVFGLQPAMAQDGERCSEQALRGLPHGGLKLVGPAFTDVAAKYAGQKDAATLLAGRIKNGTQGTWVPCPCQPTPSRKTRPRPWPNGCSVRKMSRVGSHFGPMLSQGGSGTLPLGSPSDHRVPALFPPQETMPVLHMMSVRRPSSLPTRTQVPRPCLCRCPAVPTTSREPGRR